MKTLHVVSHTHWDREWYRTFQEFRFRLVWTMDRLLDLLDRDPAYRFFTLDGQTIILDDYLEIRPEEEARIRRLVRAGRLLIGPWYVLPDEFLEGPEALVRNLLFGRRVCRRFTDAPQPMERIGYIPDPFGHISQLPQIGAGFDMEALCFWRGVGEAPTEFRWAAPDGSELLVLHLHDSYSNGAWLGDTPEEFLRDLAAARDSLAPHATTRHLLVMQGTDHMAARPDLSARIQAAGEALGDTVLHSTLPAYLAAVREELGSDGVSALSLRHGEMRSPERAHLLPAVLSARTWIKQQNSRCETLLTRWAEPFSALAEHLTGRQEYRGFLRQAWVWLLQNHPHDSICGCSVDQVHREMETRFAWCEQMADQVTDGSLREIAGHYLRVSSTAAAQFQVFVFNPLAAQRTDRVRVRLERTPVGRWRLADASGRTVPHRLVKTIRREHVRARMDRDSFAAWLGRQSVSKGRIMSGPYFRSLDARQEGSTAHIEIVVGWGPAADCAQAFEAAAARIASLLAEPAILEYDVYVAEDSGMELEFVAQEVPPVGFARFTVEGAEAEPDAGARSPNDAATIENEFLVVTADPADGSLTVRHRGSGLVLHGVHRFESGGDRGDEYTFCPPENDLIVSHPAKVPTIRRVDDELGSTLEVRLLYRVPQALAAADRSARSAATVDLPIVSCVTLTRGVQRVDFKTTVHNQAQDHRLRVLFPTPIVTDRSWAESAFDVVERPVALPTDTAAWAEQPAGTHPQLSFVDVADTRQGVLLANRGLPEYEVLPGTEANRGVTLALTLLRCVGWLSRGDLWTRDNHAGPAFETPEAQCLGEHTFHYALVPHAGNYLTAQREAHAFNAPLRSIAVPADGDLTDAGRALGDPVPAARMSFLECSPAAVVLSAIKSPEEGNGLIIRLFNSAAIPLDAKLKLWRAVSRAAIIPLHEGEAIRTIAEEADRLTIPLRAKEIVTLRLSFDGREVPAGA